MKRLISFVLFPVYLLIGLLVVLLRKEPEPPMFLAPEQPNPGWLRWYRRYHRTGMMQAKGAFMALSKTISEPSYFKEPEKWLEWAMTRNDVKDIDPVQRELIIRCAARTLELRKIAASALKEPPKEYLGVNKNAFNLEWVDYHSAMKGMTVETVLFHEMQKQIHDHNRFIDEVFLNA